MSKFFVQMIETKDLNEHWPEAVPCLEKAAEGDRSLVLMDIYNGIYKGEMTLFKVWPVYDPTQNPCAWVVTEMLNSDGVRTLAIRFLWGRGLDEWLSGIGIFEGIARSLGCVRLEVWGRRGWERKLKKFGFKHEYSIMGIDLRERMH